MERTLVLIKPDAIQRGLVGEIITRFERKGLPFHELVRKGFLAIAEAEPERCVVIDSGAEPGAVADAVRLAVERVLPKQ